MQLNNEAVVDSLNTLIVERDKWKRIAEGLMGFHEAHCEAQKPCAYDLQIKITTPRMEITMDEVCQEIEDAYRDCECWKCMTDVDRLSAQIRRTTEKIRNG